MKWLLFLLKDLSIICRRNKSKTILCFFIGGKYMSLQTCSISNKNYRETIEWLEERLTYSK